MQGHSNPPGCFKAKGRGMSDARKHEEGGVRHVWNQDDGRSLAGASVRLCVFNPRVGGTSSYCEKSVHGGPSDCGHLFILLLFVVLAFIGGGGSPVLGLCLVGVW